MQKGSWLDGPQLELKLKSKGNVDIILFVADWCGYCRRFLPIVSKNPASSRITIVDIDSEGDDLWDHYRVELVPTLIVFKEGKEIFRRGAKPFLGLGAKDLDDALRAAG